jgi:hypothetical protein
MIDCFNRRTLLSAAIASWLHPIRLSAMEGADGVVASGGIADLVGDLGMETHDPLLLLAAIRIAMKDRESPDRAWLSAARGNTVVLELANALVRAVPVGTKAPQTVDHGSLLRAGEQQEILLPPGVNRLRLKVRLKSPGYEQQKRISASGQSVCELRVTGVRTVQLVGAGGQSAPAAAFPMVLPWEALLVRASGNIRVQVRNLQRQDVTFAYSAFEDNRA